MWGAFPTYHLRHTTYLLSFQEHSRFQRVTTFVLYNIPAFLRPVETRSFVFIDIPAMFIHFLKLLVFSFPVGGDILSRVVILANALSIPPPLNAVGSKQKAVGGKQMFFILIPDSRILKPALPHLPPTTCRIHNSAFSIASARAPVT